MCGIAGIFGRDDPATVRRMLRHLVPRGPDDEHVVSGKDFTLGARRLSIQDVSGGRQPISDESGLVSVALNGEIYNFQELRRGLPGHEFRTRCDTEVLAHLYEEEGSSLVNSLKGMFAFAVWDARNRQGLLVRDRVGKKPLYIARLPEGALAFASEIKALLEVVPGTLNREALSHYLSLKHVPAPLTIYKEIECLPPGTILDWKTGSRTRYWTPKFDPPRSVFDEEEWADKILSGLRQAVRRRLVSDVPIGFFLSGGIDSSLITALAAEMSEAPIDTYTLVYDENSTTPAKDQDRTFARAIARRYGTVHHEEMIRRDDLRRELPGILACFDEPFAGVISTFYLARRIARDVKVALSGDGADEIFGSYRSHREAFRVGHPERWRHKMLVFSDEEKRSLMGSEMPSTEEMVRGWFRGRSDGLNAVLEAEFTTQLPDQVLTFVDRLSMAHSLEVRTPFLDHDFVDAVAGIPGEIKMRGGVVKSILKRAARRYLPEAAVSRPKEGFLMPTTDWLLQDDFLRHTLSRDRLDRHNLFEPSRVERLVAEFERGNRDLGVKVYTLLAFQVWFDTQYSPIVSVEEVA